MLKAPLNIKQNVNIRQNHKLIVLVKSSFDDYQPKKRFEQAE